MGFEKAESAQLLKKQMEFNKKIFQQGGDLLKVVPKHDIQYLPVTCSHTFAALNIVSGGVKGLHEELCDDKRMIDPQKVLSLCPSWKRPLDDGIPCIVFRRELEEACPDLPDFLSQAGNQSHDVHAKETKL